MSGMRSADYGSRVKRRGVFYSAIRSPKAAIILLLGPLLCAPAASAQKAGGRLDLSGAWQLDRAKSDFGPFADSPVVRAEVSLAVAHEGPELKITRRETLEGRERTTELVYYTDGRGELNPSTLGRVGVKSTTKLDGGKVVATSTLTRKGADGKPSTLEATDTWQLSGDGRVLTQTTTIRHGGGVQRIKQVYRRAG